MTSQVRIPNAVVFGYADYKALKDQFVLFGRTGLGIDYYHKDPNAAKHFERLARMDALSGISETGIAKQTSYIGGGWQVLETRVSITRFWACSTAMIKLACPILDPNFPLQPPPVHPEQPLSIALGYSSTLYDVGVSPNDQLDIVFTGYIDTIALKLTSKRIIATINLRDPIRFLVDNKITRLMSLRPDDLGAVADNPEGYFLAGTRDTLIKSMILDGGGYWTSALDPNPDDTKKFIGLDEQNRPLDEYRIFSKKRMDIAKSQRTPLTVAQERLELEVAGGAADPQVYNVMNRFPIEVIKHISTLELYPMELWADQYGIIHWQPRTTKLRDSESGNRIHPKDFWFRQPVTLQETSGIFPIINASMEWSTIGSINQFYLVNPNQTEGSSFAASMIMNTNQAWGFDMPVRTRFVYDDTLDITAANQGNDPQAAQILDAMLQIWGKDVKAAAIEIEGDPTIFPGDAVRVWHAGYYPPPSNLFRVEAVVHGYTATGPKRGLRTNVMLATGEFETAQGVFKGQNYSTLNGIPGTVQGKNAQTPAP